MKQAQVEQELRDQDAVQTSGTPRPAQLASAEEGGAKGDRLMLLGLIGLFIVAGLFIGIVLLIAGSFQPQG